MAYIWFPIEWGHVSFHLDLIGIWKKLRACWEISTKCTRWVRNDWGGVKRAYLFVAKVFQFWDIFAIGNKLSGLRHAVRLARVANTYNTNKTGQGLVLDSALSILSFLFIPIKDRFVVQFMISIYIFLAFSSQYYSFLIFFITIQ